MGKAKPRPTVDEIFQVLKRTSLPTVLVEGKNDIIFYRAIEEDLRDLGVDMLPAGNKAAVLELRARLLETTISAPVAFVVDSDLWVHTGVPSELKSGGIVTTSGYSVENDLFTDGNLTELLSVGELQDFKKDLESFCKWYALAVDRTLRGQSSGFRVAPGKVLDEAGFYEGETALEHEEEYPHELLAEIMEDYTRLLRGKSLFGLLHRQLSRENRHVKFSEKQLMAIGASRKGAYFQRIRELVSQRIREQQL